MDSLIGYPLKEALNLLNRENLIINIVKLIGSNKKFNDLERPYVISDKYFENSVILYVTNF